MVPVSSEILKGSSSSSSTMNAPQFGSHFRNKDNPNRQSIKPKRRRRRSFSFPLGVNPFSVAQRFYYFCTIYAKRVDHLSSQSVQDILRKAFIPLTKEEEAEVSHAFSFSQRNKVLISHGNSNIQITGHILQCLRPRALLNDEVINLYFELLKEREKREPDKFLKSHFFNTFFYIKLASGRSGYDFKSVSRWTCRRKLGYGLVECDKIFVPIHKKMHWCLVIINKTDQKFQYIDSLEGKDTQVLKVLAKYYVDEVKDKTGKDVDVSSWRQEVEEKRPQQENLFDCGMFMIKYVDFYSRGLGLLFNQEHMPYFRRRTAKEILRMRAD